MGVKVSASKMDIEQYYDKILQIIHEEILHTLSYLGEEAVSRIRDRSGEDSWFDHTGNLRSSIGYAVAAYGKKQIESAFEQVREGSTGSANGRKYVDELVQKYSDTYALIVVAGMNYAERVEALDNKDVLASTELWAKGKIDDYMSRTREGILRRISKLTL